MRLIFALLLLTSTVLADEWKVFSQPSPVYSAIPYDSGYVLATGGGVQFSTPRIKRLWTSADGLGATSFLGIAQTDAKIFAVSEYGLVAAFDKKTSSWSIANRSYLNKKVQVVPGQVISKKNNLVIAFEDCLAFFDTDQSSFFLTIDKIGNTSLVTRSPQKISIKDDSLFVFLGTEVYGRKMNWANMGADVRLVDPTSWVKKKNISDADRFFESQKQDVSKIERETLFNNYALDSVYEMTAVSGGGIVAATSNGWMAYSDGYNWQNSVPIWNGMGSYTGSYDNRMKVLSALDNGLLLAHVWGMGFFLFKDNGYTLFKTWTPQDENSCLDEYLDDYTVAIGTTAAPDSSGFLVATSGQKKYGLAYITKDGDISCLSEIGSSPIVGTLAAKIDAETGEWLVYVSSREAFYVSLGGSLDVFRLPPPSKNGGRLLVSEKKNYATPGGKAPLDFVFDKDDNALWMVTVGSLAYMDEDRDTLVQPSSTKGLIGAEYTSMDRDVQGNIWLGTADQGVFRLSKRKKSKDTLAVERWATEQGLLSNKVHDLAIDPIKGMIWFAHDGGVTRYSRKDLRNAEKMMTSEAPAEVKAYPNPFRPKQGQRLVIDNISEDSFVSVYNRGGALVKSFYDSDVLGGRAEWDGTDKTGKLVAPGVYHYVVRKGSKKKTGKIILIH
ncbi:MAG: hypothetical protein IKC23_05580 [Fibrobacter sp.]|nr:hypothetical protein [Fibrobacter sp.]